ncbi:chitin disaccharide deacetylase [Photobacterium sp. MCCC 1A19761]|uniref:chitin disaccharide deacetylase n=1 Tax=Photobacterium sp. MCCC 1A19761 TaxID=3115000 RepID=UPI00307E72C9
MHVIFNADDYGLTPGVNLGIVEACRQGVVRSTTMMVGMPAEPQAVALARQTSALNVGLHLRFTLGRPLTAASSLVGEDGQFHRPDQFWHRRGFSSRDIADEVIAQLDAFQASGMKLSHVDSHHHAHSHPEIFPVVAEVMQDYPVPLRATGYLDGTGSEYRYQFDHHFYGPDLSVERLLSLIKPYQGQCDVLEIMTHPAYVDQPLLDISSYHVERAQELAILTDPALKEALDILDIRVSDFSIFAR